MIYVRSRNYMRSRNTLIIFGLLFFTFVIGFRFIINVAVDNIMIFTNTIVESGYIDPSVFEFSWDVVDTAWLDPASWELSGWMETVNAHLHEFVDIIAPTLVNLTSVLAAQMVLFGRPGVTTPMLLCDYSYIIIL